MTTYDLLKLCLKLDIRELPGAAHHPFVQLAHMAAGLGPNQPDELAWCGSTMALVHKMLGLPLPIKPARARSWMTVGKYVDPKQVLPGDICVFKRGDGVQPGPDVLDASGHVAFFDGFDAHGNVLAFGGNQKNSLTTVPIKAEQLLAVRRYN